MSYSSKLLLTILYRVARRPPGFGFVTFDDSRDAEDAVKSLDGQDFMGKRIKSEIAR